MAVKSTSQGESRLIVKFWKKRDKVGYVKQRECVHRAICQGFRRAAVKWIHLHSNVEEKERNPQVGAAESRALHFQWREPGKMRGNIRLFDTLSEIRIVSVHLPHMTEARFRLDGVKMYALLPLTGLRLKSKSAPSAVCDTAYEWKRVIFLYCSTRSHLITYLSNNVAATTPRAGPLVWRRSANVSGCCSEASSAVLTFRRENEIAHRLVNAATKALLVSAALAYARR